MKRAIKLRTKYEPIKWKNFRKAGCYPYVLDVYENRFMFIGSFIGEMCTSSTPDEEIIKVLCQELDYLGYAVREDDSLGPINKGERRIYLQREIRTGYYHLLRQDSNGIWSHKYPGELPTQKDSMGRIIEVPEDAADNPFDGWCFRLTKKLAK